MGSSHSSHTETLKEEIIHKIEGEFGVNVKVDVDVLVEFLVKVKSYIKIIVIRAFVDGDRFWYSFLLFQK